MTHSPEPWRRHAEDTELPLGGSSVKGPVGIVDANGEAVVPDTPWCPTGWDMDRIVACVNFCRQFPTDFLQEHTAENLEINPYGSKSLADIPGFCGLIVVTTNQKEN